MQKKHKQAQSDKSMTPQEMRHSEKVKILNITLKKYNVILTEIVYFRN